MAPLADLFPSASVTSVSMRRQPARWSRHSPCSAHVGWRVGFGSRASGFPNALDDRLSHCDPGPLEHPDQSLALGAVTGSAFAQISAARDPRRGDGVLGVDGAFSKSVSAWPSRTMIVVSEHATVEPPSDPDRPWARGPWTVDDEEALRTTMMTTSRSFSHEDGRARIAGRTRRRAHFLPLSTYASPSRTMDASTFVASLDATAGSVMAKHERISPRSNGASQRRCCAGLPYRRRTSMLPCPAPNS